MILHVPQDKNSRGGVGGGNGGRLSSLSVLIWVTGAKTEHIKVYCSIVTDLKVCEQNGLNSYRLIVLILKRLKATFISFIACIYVQNLSEPDFDGSMSQHSFMAQIFNINQVVCSWKRRKNA